MSTPSAPAAAMGLAIVSTRHGGMEVSHPEPQLGATCGVQGATCLRILRVGFLFSSWFKGKLKGAPPLGSAFFSRCCFCLFSKLPEIGGLDWWLDWGVVPRLASYKNRLNSQPQSKAPMKGCLRFIFGHELQETLFQA